MEYNILICDDDRDIVEALRIYLSAEGYRIFPAYTGQEAIDILRRETIHLVLMDIMMPVLDGDRPPARDPQHPGDPAHREKRGHRQSTRADDWRG